MNMISQRTYKTISFERKGKVLWCRLSRPEKRNLVDDDLHEELSYLFEDVDRDKESDVIVLTGVGTSFCPGGDAKWMQQKLQNPDEFRDILPDTKRIVQKQLSMEKPIVCAINGHAAGLGASIALMCDIILAADDIKIGDPHVKMGFVAGDGGPVIWPHLIGMARAKEFLLMGDMIDAPDAQRMGLVNHVHPRHELETETQRVAEKLASGAKWAVRWTKVLMNLPLKQAANQIMDAAVAYEMMSNLTKDHAEAVTAFLEKRPAKFSGE